MHSQMPEEGKEGDEGEEEEEEVSELIEDIKRHIRWLALGPDRAELMVIWLWRTDVPPPSDGKLKRLLSSLDALLDKHADQVFAALESSPSAKYPLPPSDTWTREFYRRHNRQLPEAWRQ